MRAFVRVLGGAVIAAALASAQATQLNFDTVPVFSDVPQDYGDRVAVFGAEYGSAGGPTPHVVVEYVPTSSAMPFSIWPFGYATLTNALGHIDFSVQGYLQFTPDPGYDVVLHSFEVAAWELDSYENSRIRVANTAGATLYDSGIFTFAPNAVTTYPGSPIRSSLPMRLSIQEFGNLGLDNVVFGEVAAIPEPATYALMVVGLACVGYAARKRIQAK